MLGRIRHIIRRLVGAEDSDVLTRLVNASGQPNVNGLWRTTKDLEALRLNVKLLGYELARSQEHRLQAIPLDAPRTIGLESKPVTQDDIETRWFRSWCEQLRERPRYHRVLWSYGFVLQALHEAGALKPGARLLALDDPGQPLTSYLARVGLPVVIQAEGPLRHIPDQVDLAEFQRLVTQTAPDAPRPSDRDGLWSFGAACRQGSIRKGMDYVLHSLEALKPGGVAVHFFDFNYSDDSQTIDNWPHVLFRKAELEALIAELAAAGHTPMPASFYAGHQPLDRYIDIPPFDTGRNAVFDRLWRDGWESAHLKISIDGFACTSYGLIVKKGRV